jgi:Flp pilus assembly protein TadG
MGFCNCKRGKAQRGVAMVEFAITLPLLLLMLLAIGEFGRMLYQYNSLLQASRDAGRFVAAQAWNSTLGTVDLNSNLQAQAKNIAVYGVPSTQAGFPPVVPGLTTANVQVSSLGAEHVQVSISYNFCPVIGAGNCAGNLPGFFGNSIALNIPLIATTVMRVL